MSSNTRDEPVAKATTQPTIHLAPSPPPSGHPTDPSSSSSSATRKTTSTVTTSGSIVQSSDPSVRSDANLTQKLSGDLKGAVNGTVGSLQAATGAAIRNKEMEEKGLEKMSEEDHRLGSKRGVMPVGSGTRNTTEREGGEGADGVERG